MTQNEFKELKDVCAKYTTDDIVVVAMPTKVKNSGKTTEAVEFNVLHRLTGKNVRFLYREDFSNLRNTVKKAVDELINGIHQEIVKPKEKPKNSL